MFSGLFCVAHLRGLITGERARLDERDRGIAVFRGLDVVDGGRQAVRASPSK